MTAQAAKAARFRALHEWPGTFIIPNPWDAGTAKILASLGFEALATTSAGFAFALGRPDGEGAIGRDETLENARTIVEATGLPVSADLENGFGDEPEACAVTIARAGAIGLVGGTIEDATGRTDDPIYPFELALDRVKAAVRAARALPYPFMLTARAENFLFGRPDLADTIRRLEAFAAAGADVLYAPGVQTRDGIAAIVSAVAPKPREHRDGPRRTHFLARRSRSARRQADQSRFDAGTGGVRGVHPRGARIESDRNLRFRRASRAVR